MRITGAESLASMAATHTYEAMEMHMYDEKQASDEALCKAECPADKRMGVDYYMEHRKNGFGVGTGCEAYKVLVLPFAGRRSRALEFEGRADVAEDYRELADGLARETGLDSGQG